MPELPEVETVRTALGLALAGRIIVRLSHVMPALRRRALPDDLSRLAVGRRIAGFRRRGKFLVCDFDGHPGQALLMHLGMTGSFRVEAGNCGLRKHDHVVWELDNGLSWRFNDPRRFGFCGVADLDRPGGMPVELAGLGPEPLGDDFNGDMLAAAAASRQVPVKSFILDQRVVAGVGNIYASEALFRAGIHPDRSASRISRPRWHALATAIREVLLEAIACGGTTIRDFTSLNGSEGHFSICLNAYGRERQPCPRCGPGPLIRRTIQAGRSTYYCPRCQH